MCPLEIHMGVIVDPQISRKLRLTVGDVKFVGQLLYHKLSTFLDHFRLHYFYQVGFLSCMFWVIISFQVRGRLVLYGGIQRSEIIRRNSVINTGWMAHDCALCHRVHGGPRMTVLLSLWTIKLWMMPKRFILDPERVFCLMVDLNLIWLFQNFAPKHSDFSRVNRWNNRSKLHRKLAAPDSMALFSLHLLLYHEHLLLLRSKFRVSIFQLFKSCKFEPRVQTCDLRCLGLRGRGIFCIGRNSCLLRACLVHLFFLFLHDPW